MLTTMNGYGRIDTFGAALTRVTVAGHETTLRAGAVSTVLTELGRRFHAEVEPIVTFNGWRAAALNTASGGIPNSNHLSGTAVDINGYRHPRYRHGTFTASQVAAIRRILADLGGVARWGGDWGSQVDAMHFEIIAPLVKVTAVANQVSAPPAPPAPPTPVADPTPLTPHLEDPDVALNIITNGDNWAVTNGLVKRELRGDGAVRAALDLGEITQAQVDLAKNGRLAVSPTEWDSRPTVRV